MEYIQQQKINCPYCGELIDIVVDCSIEEQEYIEDCQVCCRPMTIRASVSSEMSAESELCLIVSHENE